MSGQAVMARICAICIMGFCICFGPLRGTKVDKCSDFYSHACAGLKESGFLLRNKKTDREKYVARVDKLKTNTDSPFYSYYQSCLKRESSASFLTSKMRQIIRGAYNKGKKLDEEDIAKLLDETATLDNTLFEFGYEHTNKNKFVIGGRTSLMQSEIKSKSSDYEKYQAFVKQLIYEIDSLYEENEWVNVLKLEQEIIEAVDKHDHSYYFNHGKLFYYEGKDKESYTMTQLSDQLKQSKGASEFKLAKFLQYFHDRISSGVLHSEVVFMGLAYFKELQDILSEYETHIIARYIFLRSVLALYYTLPQRFQEIPSNEIASKLDLRSWLTKEEDQCVQETNLNMNDLEEQYYMDKSFSGPAGAMADYLYKSIKENLEIKIRADSCLPNNKVGDILRKLQTMTVHLGRFELPYFQYKKTSFYNGSYFENVLALKREFIQTIAEGEKGFGLKNLTSFRRARKISYYDKLNNTLYIFSYVFNTATDHKSEFFGAAGPHIVEALFNAFNKEDFTKCSLGKKKKQLTAATREKPEEYFLETKLDLSFKADQSQTSGPSEIQTFFLTFAKEFCGLDEEKERLNKVLSSNKPFRTAFQCPSS